MAISLADDVLLREGPFPFEKQNASHHHILSLAGYLESPAVLDTAAPILVIHGKRPWLQPRTVLPFQPNIPLAMIPFYLCVGVNLLSPSKLTG